MLRKRLLTDLCRQKISRSFVAERISLQLSNRSRIKVVIVALVVAANGLSLLRIRENIVMFTTSRQQS